MNNQCQPRLITVENCAVKTLNGDSCDKCSGGFILTDNQLKCLAEIPNCLLYSNDNESLTCL